MSENNNITDLNTLKNWFKQGLKPTQAQFWAWLDSFYHKNEKIPQDKISGLSESLTNKADTEQLSSKANADATDLSESNIISWKEALGVEALPTNIATIDQDSEVGNVYTKTKTNELLEEKLDKPTTEATTTEAPFVVGVNSDNESYKLPAGDLGKNIGNTNLQIPAGEVRVLDTTGAKLEIKGLNNKKNDASFINKIIMNEQGELAISDKADISIEIPANMIVNHVFPEPIKELPEALQDIKDFMTKLKGVTYTTIGKDKLILSQVDEEERVVISDGGNVAVKSSGEIDSDPKVYWGVTTDVELPADKNWVFIMSGSNITYKSRAGIQKFGFSRGVPNGSTTLNSPETAIFSILSSTITGNNLPRIVNYGFWNFTIIYTKVGDIINITALCNGNQASVNIEAMPYLGTYKFVMNGGATKGFLSEQTQYHGLKYYIDNN